MVIGVSLGAIFCAELLSPRQKIDRHLASGRNVNQKFMFSQTERISYVMARNWATYRPIAPIGKFDFSDRESIPLGMPRESIALARHRRRVLIHDAIAALITHIWTTIALRRSNRSRVIDYRSPLNS